MVEAPGIAPPGTSGAGASGPLRPPAARGPSAGGQGDRGAGVTPSSGPSSSAARSPRPSAPGRPPRTKKRSSFWAPTVTKDPSPRSGSRNRWRRASASRRCTGLGETGTNSFARRGFIHLEEDQRIARPVLSGIPSTSVPTHPERSRTVHTWPKAEIVPIYDTFAKALEAQRPTPNEEALVHAMKSAVTAFHGGAPRRWCAQDHAPRRVAVRAVPATGLRSARHHRRRIRAVDELARRLMPNEESRVP